MENYKPRYIPITNKVIIDSYNDIQPLQARINKNLDKMEKLEKAVKADAAHIQKLKDKIDPLLTEGIELGEFEIIASVDKNESGALLMKIVDKLEDYKEKLREVIAKNKEKQAVLESIKNIDNGTPRTA